MKTYLKLPLSFALASFLLIASSFRFHGFSAEIATMLLESLDDSQKAKLFTGFDDDKRFEWTYLPPYQVPRNGLPLKEMNDDQKELVGQLLSSSLSEAGYKKVKLIMSLEEILAELESNPKRDPEMYFLSINGQPSGTEPWSWQFQGHHVSLHFTIVDGDVSYTPRFLGSNPGEVKEGARKGLRALNKEEDLGFALLSSLTSTQKEQAIFSDETFKDRDIVTKSIKDVAPLDAVGVDFKQLNETQRKMLWAIIDEYLSVMPSPAADERKKSIIKEGTQSIRFGWAGSTSKGAPHYYRIQGPSFLIEFDNTQGGGNHIHSVWRDFDGDFGKDLIKEHYAKTKH